MAEADERDRFFQRFGDKLPPEIFFENAALRFRLIRQLFKPGATADKY
jgi:hypothetical protein